MIFFVQLPPIELLDRPRRAAEINRQAPEGTTCNRQVIRSL